MGASAIAGLLAGAYLIGSIPFALLIGFAWKRVDIRKYGSGNIGATNVLRVLGWPAALLCFVLDAAKGLGPVWYAQSLPDVDPLLVVGVALAAILGHNFSVFLGFRGGKGVATSLGVLIAIAPHIAGLVFFLWVLVVVVTRYISVASILAGVSVPVLMLLSSRLQDTYWGRPVPQEYLYLGLLGAGFILIKHRPNLVRLMNGTEPRVGQRIPVERSGEAAESRGGRG